MSRNRKWWHKTNHDRLMRDQFVWNLPDEVLGLLKRLECWVGSTERGHETGFLCHEDGEKISRPALTLQLSRGDKKVEAKIDRRLEMLANAKELCPLALKRGQVRLLKWQSDQEAPATVDSARMRESSDEAMVKEAKAFRPELQRYFNKLGDRPVSDGDLLSFIKAMRGGYSKTQKKFLEILKSEGVLTCDSDSLSTLASLATDSPAGVGLSGDRSGSATNVGTGSENLSERKFSINPDSEPNIDLGMRIHSQLDSAGDGESVASEARPITFALCEPSDAYRCPDPLAASIEFLSQCPGWSEKRFQNKPSSAVVLRSRWRELREDPTIGSAEAERIWRTCLDAAITDRLDRQGWKCWVAIFQTRVLRQVEVLRPLPAEVAENRVIGLRTGRNEHPERAKETGLR